MFEKINIIQSGVIATPVENIDTDQIIPARFLKKTTREGFGAELFKDWRFTENGAVRPDSVFAAWDRQENGAIPGKERFPAPLPKPQILVAGKNFGCGSSREHAAWALSGYGFKAVVSSFFADIFKNNALNNGLLPVQVSETFLREIFRTVQYAPSTPLRIDLTSCTVELLPSDAANHPEANRLKETFPITPYKQQCLLQGQEDIDYLLTTRPAIEAYEKQRIF